MSTIHKAAQLPSTAHNQYGHPNCDEAHSRITQLAKVCIASLQMAIDEYVLTQAGLIDPISFVILKNPVRLNCACKTLFERASIEEWKTVQVIKMRLLFKCPCCATNASIIQPDPDAKGEIEKVRQEHRIPTISEYSTSIKGPTYLEFVEQLEKERNGEKAALGYTHLALDCFQRKESLESIRFLEKSSLLSTRCRFEVHSLLSSVCEAAGQTEAAVKTAFISLAEIRGREDLKEQKRGLFQRIVMLAPRKWDNYDALLHLADTTEGEKVTLAEWGAEEAFRAQNLKIVQKFYKVAKSAGMTHIGLSRIFDQIVSLDQARYAPMIALLPRPPIPDIAFGRKDYLELLKIDVGEEPPLPHNIGEILEASCPFTYGQKVKDTHLLVFIPRSFSKNGGSPINFSLNELLKMKGVAGFRYLWPQIRKEFGEKGVDSHWVLMMKTVISGSKKTSIDEQLKLLHPHRGYDLPNIIDLITGTFLQHLRLGMHLFTEEGVMARCKDEIDGVPIVIGDFDEGGIRGPNCSFYRGASSSIAIAPARRFSYLDLLGQRVLL